MSGSSPVSGLTIASPRNQYPPHVSIRVTHPITHRALGWKFAEGKVTFGGSGDSDLSFTHRADIARYLAYVLTHSPPSDLAWKTLHIQGELIVRPSSQTCSSCLFTRSP